MSLLNACNSRTQVISSAWAVDYRTEVSSFEDLYTAGKEIPLWIIGSKDSLLLLPGGPAKVLSTMNSEAGTNGSVEKYVCGELVYANETFPHQGLMMMSAERYDAIIDFTDLKEKVVYIINTGKPTQFVKKTPRLL